MHGVCACDFPTCQTLGQAKARAELERFCDMSIAAIAAEANATPTPPNTTHTDDRKARLRDRALEELLANVKDPPTPGVEDSPGAASSSSPWSSTSEFSLPDGSPDHRLPRRARCYPIAPTWLR